MSINDGGFDFYSDAGLTTRLSAILSQHNGASFPTSNNFQVWLGSRDPAYTLVSSSGNLELTAEDSAPGSGHETSAIKLALTSGGLGAGTSTLDLGVTSIEGGVANAVDFWIRVTDAIGTQGYSNELTLALNAATAVA